MCLFLCPQLLKKFIYQYICDSNQLTIKPFNVNILIGDDSGEFCNYRWFELT